MKGIKQVLNFGFNFQNFDSAFLKFDEKLGFCVVSDGKKSKGILSNKWAEYLCQKTPLIPFSSFNALQLFLDSIWEEHYEETKVKISDPFTLRAFEKQGSLATYCACWFRQENRRTWFQWMSYGNSAVLVYDQKNDELFVPEYGNNLLGFLENEGLLNWKDEKPDEKYFLSGNEQELTQNLKIILATDTMAEHLALSYLIIKSKDDDYWDILSKVMQEDKQLSNLIFNNRNAYNYQSFNELLVNWQKMQEINQIDAYIDELRKDGKLGIDDLTMMVLGYNPDGEEFVTKPDKIIFQEPLIKEKAERIEQVKKPLFPEVIIKQHQFKHDKENFINHILDNKITRLFHFTDKSNIESIKKLGGLFSWEYLICNGINIPRPGGDQLSRMLDSRFGLQDFVRTSFCKTHPMMHVAMKDGRIHSPLILEIDPSIITFKETLFSDRNATKKGHFKGESLQDLERIRLDICMKKDYFNLDETEKQYYQAEVMVKSFIPAKYILNL